MDGNAMDFNGDIEQTTDANKLQAWQQLLTLLTTHITTFQQKLIQNRRRSQQRLRRRQDILRSHYLNRLLDIQSEFFIQLPLPFSPNDSRGNFDKTTPLIAEESSTEDEPKFWEHIVAKYTATEWLQTFRMTRRTFRWLCEQLENALKPVGTSVPLKNLIALEKRIALSIYALASGADYRIVADLFGVSRTSVCKFMKRFADAVIEKLAPYLLAMPESEEDYELIRSSFHYASNMPPLVVGCLGFSEISVSPVADDITLFTNDAGNATVILQSLIDDKLLFRKVCIETKRPRLFLEAPNDLTKLKQQFVGNRYFSPFVVCQTEYYPLRPWLMRQYTQPTTQQQQDFNEAIENVLVFKDNAYRRLYARWKVLQRKCDLEPKTMEVIATACCALHNLLEENEDGFLEEWADNVDATKFRIGHFKRPRNMLDSLEGIKTRDLLSQLISSTQVE